MSRYQKEMEKKTNKIIELHSEYTRMKTKLLELNLQIEEKDLSDSGYLHKELWDCSDCKVLQEELEASHQKLEDQKPFMRTLFDLRARFLSCKTNPIPKNFSHYRWKGNRAAHDGNIIVDVSLFKSGNEFGENFTVTEHGEMFETMYGRPVLPFLSPDFHFETLKSMSKVCGMFSYRATMAACGSFTDESLAPDIDNEFEVLEASFDKICK